MLNRIKFQYYPGDITKPSAIGYLTLQAFINAHINPTNRSSEVFMQIEEAAKNGNKKLKSKLKQENLFYFTPSATFKKNYHRRYENIESFTGLAQLDFDNYETEEEAIDLKEYLFENYPQFFCVYLSPSRKGVKGLMRIPVVESVEEYQEYYKGIEDEFEWISNFDSAPKNVALPLFLSKDVDLLYRNDATIWDTVGILPDISTYKNLTDTQPNNIIANIGDETIYKSDAYYEHITIDIFKNKLSTINDAGHPILRNACLVLGSRCAAGYLSTNDARQIAENEIRSHHYLKKGIANYIKTANWAINRGLLAPKYYE